MSVIRFLGRVQLGSSALGSHMDVISWWLKLGQWQSWRWVGSALFHCSLRASPSGLSPGQVWAFSNHEWPPAVRLPEWQLWSSVSVSPPGGRNSLTSSDLALGIKRHHFQHVLLVTSNSQACSGSEGRQTPLLNRRSVKVLEKSVGWETSLQPSLEITVWLLFVLT